MPAVRRTEGVWGATDVAAAATTAALVLGFDPLGWYSFAPVKWAVATVGTATVAAAASWTGTWRRPGRLIGGLLAGLLAWMALAAWRGADPRFAWLGLPERHAGWLLWLCCAVLFLAGARRRAVVDGLVVAGVGLAPVLVADAFGHPVVAAGTERLTGTFGSAAYLGAACVLIAPVAASVALDASRAVAWRRVGGVAAGSALFGVVGSGTRGAWVALAAVGGWALVRGRRRRATWFAATAALLVTIAAAATTPVGTRVGSAMNRESPGGANRVDEWRVGTAALADHLLLGAGPEGYRIAFADGVDPDYERAHGRSPLPDRAHNGVLDIALAGGVPAAVLYVGFIGIGVVTMRRRRLGRADRAAALALVAYLIQQQFLFPLAEVEPIAFLLFGSLVLAEAPALTLAHPWPRVGRAAGASLAGVIGIVALWWGARDVLADRAARDAVSATNSADASRAARHAVDLRPDELRLRLLLASVTDDEAERGRAIDDALAWSPHDPIVELQQAQRLTAQDPARAVTYLAGLVAHDRNNAALQLLYGTAAVRVGDELTAERAWLTAMDLAPHDPGPRSNLVRLYREQGRDQEADALIGAS